MVSHSECWGASTWLHMWRRAICSRAFCGGKLAKPRIPQMHVCVVLCSYFTGFFVSNAENLSDACTCGALLMLQGGLVVLSGMLGTNKCLCVVLWYCSTNRILFYVQWQETNKCLYVLCSANVSRVSFRFIRNTQRLPNARACGALLMFHGSLSVVFGKPESWACLHMWCSANASNVCIVCCRMLRSQHMLVRVVFCYLFTVFFLLYSKPTNAFTCCAPPEFHKSLSVRFGMPRSWQMLVRVVLC